jgi:hypothetical protein
MPMKREIILFLQLRHQLAETFLKENVASSNDITKWKGRDITNFQESLLNKVKAQVSEKWFYTYCKNENPEKIPRIDILNILSEYVGRKDWASFVDEINRKENNDVSLIENKKEERQTEQMVELPNASSGEIKPKNKSFFRRKIFVIGLITSLSLSLFVGILFLLEILPLKYHYEFCFIDSDRNKQINSALEITLLQEGESPIHYKSNEIGCFSVQLKENKIKLVVKSPYYKQDTLYRVIKSKYHNERVELKTDDYALMLYYFSHSKEEDWKRRRKELNKMIANNAIIYQVYGNESYGVDILSKEDFIDKLTLPTSSLKNLNIIETEKKKNKIVKLKFEVIPDEN